MRNIPILFIVTTMSLILLGLFVAYCAAEETSPYIVKIRTDRWHISPTHDPVFLKLIGSDGVSRNISLDNSDSEEFNAPNKLDVFRFDDAYIGILKGVQITKVGFDRFLWSEIIVKTPRWTEHLNELDSYNEGLLFNRTFFVKSYKGCPKNTFWNRELCQKCPANSCSFAGSLSSGDCIASTCLIHELRSKIDSLKHTLELQKEHHDAKINEFTANLKNFESQLTGSVSKLSEDLHAVSNKANTNNVLIKVTSKELSDEIKTIAESQSRDAVTIKASIAAVNNNVNSTAFSLSQAKEKLSSNSGRLSSIRKDIDSQSGEISQVSKNLNSRAESLEEALATVNKSASKNTDIVFQINADVELVTMKYDKQFQEATQTLTALEEALDAVKTALSESKAHIEEVKANSTSSIEKLSGFIGTQLQQLDNATRLNNDTLSKIGFVHYDASSQDDFYRSGIQFHYPGKQLAHDDTLEISGTMPENLTDSLTIALLQTNGDSPLTVRFAVGERTTTVYLEGYVDGVLEHLEAMDLPDAVVPGGPLNVQIFVEKYEFYVSINLNGMPFPYVKPLSELDVRVLQLSGDKFCSRVSLERLNMVSRSGGVLEEANS